MPNQGKQTYSISGDKIHFNRTAWSKLASATYREDYFDEIVSLTWTENKGYLYNNKLNCSLHHYIMSKWYGAEVLDNMLKNEYVVDHINNDGFDCTISNLEFLKRTYNVAKGNSLDIDAEKMRLHASLNIFKDFTTECYQITIAFTDEYYCITSNGECTQVSSVRFLYNKGTDYFQVILDAENILKDIESAKSFSYKKLHACDYKFEGVMLFNDLSEEEKKSPIIIRNGETYINMSTGHNYFLSASYEKGWLPPEQ